MVDPSRMDALLQGLAHRQQMGVSMHASRMQELDSQIAQVDQELVTQTCNLVRTGEEADQAHKEEIELKAELEELSAGLEAYTKENKALHRSIEQSKQELIAAEEDEHSFKQAFLHTCSQLNARFRKVQEEHPGSFFDNLEQRIGPETNQTSPTKSCKAAEMMSEEEIAA